MTKPIILISLVFILAHLLSCGNKQKESDATKKHETPAALQDDKIEFKSYSRSGDLIEELYQELVNKSQELKKLEDELETYRTKPNNLTGTFHNYEGKSVNYYNSANYKATAIKDTLLRKKILTLITKSNNQYTTKTAELNSLLKQISENEGTLNDHHTVLKISLTLPIIEKYQDDNKPAKNEFENLIKHQERLIQDIDSLTPKN